MYLSPSDLFHFTFSFCSIHVAANGMNLSFLISELYSMAYKYHIFLIYVMISVSKFKSCLSQCVCCVIWKSLPLKLSGVLAKLEYASAESGIQEGEWDSGAHEVREHVCPYSPMKGNCGFWVVFKVRVVMASKGRGESRFLRCFVLMIPAWGLPRTEWRSLRCCLWQGFGLLFKV